MAACDSKHFCLRTFLGDLVDLARQNLLATPDGLTGRNIDGDVKDRSSSGCRGVHRAANVRMLVDEVDQFGVARIASRLGIAMPGERAFVHAPVDLMSSGCRQDVVLPYLGAG